MQSSESIKELASALAKAQPAIEGATKDKDNPFFKSKYADLASVAEAIAKPIAANGLSYVQHSHDRDNAAAIETIILHASGEWMSCGIVSVPVSKNDAQGFGSALTYARRYSLSAAFGVVPEDDDGNAAAKAKPVAGASGATVKQEAFEALSPDEQKFLREIAANVIALLTEDRADDAYGYLRNQKLDTEEQVAIQHLFDSKQRSALAKAGEQFKMVQLAAERQQRKAAA